jgi:HK97 family phage major capsid protein
MANQIPISSVSAAGGYLVQPELGDALISKVARQAGVLSLANVQRISTSSMTWPVYLGRPTAGFVAEAAAKPMTGAEFGTLTANVKKIATNVRYTQEILEDARINPEVLINPDVESAFADLIDYHAIGTHVGAANTTATFTSSFDAALANTTQTVELGTGADALAIALSSALGTLEGQGYMDGLSVLAGPGLKAHLRDARDTQGRPLYTDGFTTDVPRVFGLPMAFSTNVNRTDAGVYSFSTGGLIGGAGSPAKTVAIVGDFNNAKAVIRRDLYTQTFREATIGGVNLAETNQIAVQWEMRMGFQIFDLNRAFVRIVNAA